MSIWCSWPHIGTDPSDLYDLGDGLVQVDIGVGKPRGRKLPKIAERGNVLSYAEGFSNHHPDLTGTHERPAIIAVAHIAPWCVPGHDQYGDGYACRGCGVQHDDEVGPWLRLEVFAPEALDFWEKDDDGNPAVTAQEASVVLDRAAVEALRDDLDAWLARTHVEVDDRAEGQP